MADSEETSSWQVGDFRVTAIVESQTAHMPIGFLIPKATKDDVRSQPWLLDHYAYDDGTINLRIQSFVVDDGNRVVLVDPCVGNNKARLIPTWNQQDYPFLKRLIAAGYPPDSIDMVVHTHLHDDHVGWDTTLDPEGRWTPTFKNARHLYVESELDYWSQPEQRTHQDVYADSIEPILDAGLADIVGLNSDLGGGLHLEPAVGHTPGQVTMVISSGSDTALISGDFIHHPMQCGRPDLDEIADWDGDIARTTRRAWLDRCASDGLLTFGTHFANRPCGHFVTHDGAWKFNPVEQP